MGKKLLIVDDSLIVRSGLETALGKSDLFDEIIVAENGRKGIEKIQSESPSVVLMDVDMPELDGIGALEEISKKKKSGEIDENIPIIILSGTMYENEKNVRKAKMLGAADVVAKPEGKAATISIDTDDLEERIKSLL